MPFPPTLGGSGPLTREASIDCYAQPETRIGAGAQGTVYKYTHRPTGKVYAAKVMYYNNGNGDTNYKRNILREQTVALEFEHAHLMKAHEVFEYPEGFVIVMPCYTQGSLAKKRKMLNPPELKNAIRQILMALQHLHGGDFIHRDIKPDNVLVSNLEGEHLHLVVADYGLMTWENPVTVCGTPGYIAPEIYHNNKFSDVSKKHQYDDKVDIYALGILILEMLGIHIPPDYITTQYDFTELVKLRIAKEFDKCERYDPGWIDVLNVADRMLQFAPIIRPSAEECLQLPCLNRAIASPAPRQWSSPSSNVSTINSFAGFPGTSVEDDWWESIEDSNRHKTGKRKKIHRGLNPRLTTHKHRVHKKQHHPLPTPRATPQKNHKARKFEEDEPEDAEMATDAPPLSDWDEIPISD